MQETDLQEVILDSGGHVKLVLYPEPSLLLDDLPEGSSSQGLLGEAQGHV